MKERKKADTHEFIAHVRVKMKLIYFSFRFDEDVHHVELDYPRDMSIWEGIGYHIDAAFQYKDGKNIFNIQYSSFHYTNNF